MKSLYETLADCRHPLVLSAIFPREFSQNLAFLETLAKAANYVRASNSEAQVIVSMTGPLSSEGEMNALKNTVGPILQGLYAAGRELSARYKAAEPSRMFIVIVTISKQ